LLSILVIYVNCIKLLFIKYLKKVNINARPKRASIWVVDRIDLKVGGANVRKYKVVQKEGEKRKTSTLTHARSRRYVEGPETRNILSPFKNITSVHTTTLIQSNYTFGSIKGVNFIPRRITNRYKRARARHGVRCTYIIYRGMGSYH